MQLSELLTLSIVSHGHGPLVEKLTEQLDSIPALRGVELVVTLNAPGETFRFESSPLRNVRLRTVRNPAPQGFGANHNQAFEQCRTAWFAILNPDLSIQADVFSTLMDVAVAKQASLIAPTITNSDGSLEDSVRHNLTPWSLMKRRFRPRDESDLSDGRFHWFAGMFYIVNSAAYRAIGGFDARYFLYCEDYDLCARLHLASGALVFQPDVKVVHDAQRASRRSRKYLAMHLKSMFRVWLSSPVWRIALWDALRQRSRPA